MAKMTPEEIHTAVSEMIDAGFNEGEIDGFLRDQGALPQMGMDQPLGQQGLRVSQQAAMIAGPIVGGIYGSALTAGRGALTQMVGEGAGAAIGDAAGRFAAGQPQDIKQSLATGGTAGILGGAYRGVTQAAGKLGGVPSFAIQEAGVPTMKPRVPFTDVQVPSPIPLPAIGKVTRAAPRNVSQVAKGTSAEASLADRVRAASAKLLARITPERAAKEEIIRQSSRSGVRIPVAPIQDALRAKLISDPSPVTPDGMTFNARLQGTIQRLDQATASTGGTLSPMEIDRLIRQQLRPKVYTASGQPSHTMYAEAIGDAERASTDLLNKALPGNVRAMNEAITARLDAAEKAAKLFGEDRPGVINRLRTLHHPGNEDSMKSLLVLAHEVDPRLAKEAMRLATKRAFAGDIREASQAGRGGFFGIEARTPLRVAAQTMAPFQSFAGPAAAPFAGPAAYDAFQRAMEPRNNP